MYSTHTIIVNYNAGAWLTRAVNSALQFTDGQISVVDNASTDGSVAETQRSVGKHARLNWHINGENRGFAAANNQVLAKVSEQFVILMNPDCELNSATIEPIMQSFASNQEIALASCQILNQDGTLQATSRRRFPTPWSGFVRLLRLHRWFPDNERFANFDYGDIERSKGIKNSREVEFVEAISGAFMVLRQSVLKTVGLLDEDYFMHCEDLDWCKRIDQAGFKVAFVHGASVVHAKGVSSAARPVRVLWWLHLGMNRFFNKFYLQQTSWPMRVLVKLGIAASFILRSIVVTGARLFSGFRRK